MTKIDPELPSALIVMLAAGLRIAVVVCVDGEVSR
jgi:hypothetical protein